MLLWVLAVATMTIGNITRHRPDQHQTHAGLLLHRPRRYLMVALVSANQLGAVSLLYYLLAYTLMNLGAFVW